MNKQHPDTAAWWRHRRRHSYISQVGLFALIAIGLFLDSDQLSAAGPLFQTLAWIFGLIVLTYLLAATAEDMAGFGGLKK